jgi:hypothetical protein
MADQTPKAAVPPAPPAGPPIRIDRSRKPKFSLRSMLIATTAFAVVAAFSTFVGIEQLFVLLAGLWLLFLVPVALATLAAYSRGPRRTFFAGAFGGSLASHYMHWDLEWGDSWLHALFLVGLLAITIITCGFTAVYTRRFLERRGWHLPPSDDAG